MRAMELKPSIIITLIFLFFIMSLPISSQGLMEGHDSAILEPEIYEIDYRGPETHSYVPPPTRTGSGGRDHHHPFVHQHDPRKAHSVRGDHDVERRP